MATTQTSLTLRKSTLWGGCVSAFEPGEWSGYALLHQPSLLDAFVRRNGEPDYHNTDDPRTFGYQPSAVSYYEFYYNEWEEDQEWVRSQPMFYSDDEEDN